MEELRKFNYQDQVIGALIGNATGDALGLPVDFSKRKDLKVDPVLEMQGFGSYLAIAGNLVDEYVDEYRIDGIGARM